MIYNHTVGTTVHFGPHALLPPECLRLLLRLLNCRNCYFRTLYHRISVEEMRDVSKTPNKHGKSHVMPFHSLSRAIRAVLRGLQHDGNDLKSFVIQTRSETSISHLRSDINYHLKAIVHTTFVVREKLLVCPSHGHEIVDIFYSLGDGKNEFSPAGSPINSVILKGRSEFFRSVLLYEQEYTSSDASCNSEVRCPHIRSDKSAEVLRFNTYQADDGIKMFYAGLTGIPLENAAISDANRRWHSSYSCDCTDFRVFSPCPNLHSTSTESCKRRVHFPAENPVSSVHILRTYATACQLERRDHTWLFEAQRSLLEQYSQLSSDSLENDTSFNNQFEQPNDSAVTPKTLLQTPKVDVPAHDSNDNTPVPKRKSRRRKRHRKRTSLKLLYCASAPQIPVDCDIEFMYLANTDPKSCAVLITEPSN